MDKIYTVKRTLEYRGTLEDLQKHLEMRQVKNDFYSPRQKIAIIETSLSEPIDLTNGGAQALPITKK